MNEFTLNVTSTWNRIHEDNEKMGFMLNIGWAWIQMHKNDGSNDFCMSFLTSTKVYENNESTEKKHKNVKDPWEQITRVVVVVVLAASVQGEGWSRTHTS